METPNPFSLKHEVSETYQTEQSWPDGAKWQQRRARSLRKKVGGVQGDKAQTLFQTLKGKAVLEASLA